MVNPEYSSGSGRAGEHAGAGAQAPGALSITFGFPTGGFLYRATSPRLRIDGTEIQVPGWGRHDVPVPAGRHQVEVWVPYAMPRKAGRARTDVAVRGGERVALEYMAPSVTLMRGSLGAPGQKSAGWSGVMVLNVIGVLVLLVAVVVFLL